MFSVSPSKCLSFQQVPKVTLYVASMAGLNKLPASTKSNKGERSFKGIQLHPVFQACTVVGWR